MPEWIIAALLAVNAALLAAVAVILYVELRLMEKLKAELLRRVETSTASCMAAGPERPDQGGHAGHATIRPASSVRDSGRARPRGCGDLTCALTTATAAAVVATH